KGRGGHHDQAGDPLRVVGQQRQGHIAAKGVARQVKPLRQRVDQGCRNGVHIVQGRAVWRCAANGPRQQGANPVPHLPGAVQAVDKNQFRGHQLLLSPSNSQCLAIKASARAWSSTGTSGNRRSLAVRLGRAIVASARAVSWSRWLVMVTLTSTRYWSRSCRLDTTYPHITLMSPMY